MTRTCTNSDQTMAHNVDGSFDHPQYTFRLEKSYLLRPFTWRLARSIRNVGWRNETGFSPLLTVPRRYFFYGSFVLFISCVFHAFPSVHCCIVVTCWEGLTSWLLFVTFNCVVFVTFPWGTCVPWVRCGTWLYRFLNFAAFLTFKWVHTFLSFHIYLLIFFFSFCLFKEMIPGKTTRR